MLCHRRLNLVPEFRLKVADFLPDMPLLIKLVESFVIGLQLLLILHFLGCLLNRSLGGSAGSRGHASGQWTGCRLRRSCN